MDKDKEYCQRLKQALEICNQKYNNSSMSKEHLPSSKVLCKYYHLVYSIKCIKNNSYA